MLLSQFIKTQKNSKKYVVLISLLFYFLISPETQNEGFPRTKNIFIRYIQSSFFKQISELFFSVLEPESLPLKTPEGNEN